MERERQRIKTLIVDDEPLARKNLRLLLKDDNEIDIIGECSSGQEALKAINSNSPDLIYLDIQMPGMNGFELLQQLDPIAVPVIVFVTAYDQYALAAFEVHAIDYLLKPFDDERFARSLEQAKLQVEQREVNKLSRKLFALINDNVISPTRTVPVSQNGYLTRFMVRSANRIILVKVDDVDYIAADDYYVKISSGTRSHLLRESLNDLESQLDPAMFVRVHRSTIVNVDRIKELQPHFNGDYIVVLNDGKEFKLSRSRREKVQTLLTNERRK